MISCLLLHDRLTDLLTGHWFVRTSAELAGAVNIRVETASRL